MRLKVRSTIERYEQSPYKANHGACILNRQIIAQRGHRSLKWTPLPENQRYSATRYDLSTSTQKNAGNPEFISNNPRCNKFLSLSTEKRWDVRENAAYKFCTEYIGSVYWD